VSRFSPELDVDRLADLLIAARDGTSGGFERLISACRPIVERQALRVAWRSGDVDDIVQEVCIRLFEHAGTIREPRSLLNWLTIVTRRAASQVGRRGARLVPTDLDDSRSTSASTEDQAMRSYERREVTDGVRSALTRLDAEDRRVLLLLEGDGSLSYRQVSTAVCRPIGSLGPTRQRLLQRLRVDPAVRRLRPAS
jgi:RNA polymerase sigma factor (sigma-70 family)